MFLVLAHCPVQRWTGRFFHCLAKRNKSTHSSDRRGDELFPFPFFFWLSATEFVSGVCRMFPPSFSFGGLVLKGFRLRCMTLHGVSSFPVHCACGFIYYLR